MNEVQTKKRQMARQLSSYYSTEEAEQIARLLLEECFSSPYPQLIIGECKVNEKMALLDDWVARLLHNEPLQYVLGHTVFGKYDLAVAPGVLIPRPETESLCEMLCERKLVFPGAEVADVCCGSGAIALYLYGCGAKVDAVEVCEDATSIARKNFEKYSADIHLDVADILAPNFRANRNEYDLVVSNPPYVMEYERSTIAPHVLYEEPSLALFVPDNDPIVFYRRIKEIYHSKVFAFEINPLCVEQLRVLFKAQETEFIEDFRGNIRYLIVT